MRIRAEQMAAFEAAAERQFENDLVAHSREFAPWVCAPLDNARLRGALRALREEAGLYEFTLRGPIRLYIELGLRLGSGFDRDPQYKRIEDILRSPRGADEACQAAAPGIAGIWTWFGSPSATSQETEIVQLRETPVTR